MMRCMIVAPAIIFPSTSVSAVHMDIVCGTVKSEEGQVGLLPFQVRVDTFKVGCNPLQLAAKIEDRDEFPVKKEKHFIGWKLSFYGVIDKL